MAGAIQLGKGATGNFYFPDFPGPLTGSTHAGPPGCELGHQHLPELNFPGRLWMPLKTAGGTRHVPIA